MARLKFSISLEKCHSFQSRLKISISEGDLEFFQDLGPLGRHTGPELTIKTEGEINSVHTKGIVKKRRFTRGICKNQ